MNKTTLFFAGDFCSKPSTSLITVSDDLRNMIQSSDIRVVNFEVPLKPDGNFPSQHYERFYQNDDVPQFLREMGFDFFSIANNHTFDWGDAGYKKTKQALGDDAFGAGSYEEAYRVKVVNVNGLKIGFLALAYAAYTGVFDDVLHRDGLGCAYINDLKVNHVIMETKQQVDYLFVLPHDGIEYIDVPLPETIARYRDFVDYGADGVIASHPHCPQGWETYRGKPIFYSLGNFFFNSKEDTLYRAWNRPHWYEGMCVILELAGDNISYRIINTRNEDNVKLYVDNDAARDEHNIRLCEYLTNEKMYHEYLADMVSRLSPMLIVDRTFHSKTLWLSTKSLIGFWKKKLMKKSANDDFALRTLLRNDSRRRLLMRAMIEE